MRPEPVQPRLNIWSKLYLFIAMFSLGAIVAARVQGANELAGAPVAAGLMLVFGCGAFASATARRIGYQRAILTCIAVASLGGLAFAVSLFFAFPFGDLRFLARWQPALDVGSRLFPLLHPLLWLLISGPSYLLAARRFSPTAAILAAGVISAAIAWAMDPVATRVLGLWEWEASGPLYGAPIQNVLGWILAGSLGAIFMRLAGFWEAAHAREALVLLGTFVLFVAGLAYLYGDWSPCWANVAIFLLLVALFPSRPGTTLALVGPAD